jgi:hypothetical protein
MKNKWTEAAKGLRYLHSFYDYSYFIQSRILKTFPSTVTGLDIFKIPAELSIIFFFKYFLPIRKNVF